MGAGLDEADVVGRGALELRGQRLEWRRIAQEVIRVELKPKRASEGVGPAWCQHSRIGAYNDG